MLIEPGPDCGLILFGEKLLKILLEFLLGDGDLEKLGEGVGGRGDEGLEIRGEGVVSCPCRGLKIFSGT